MCMFMLLAGWLAGVALIYAFGSRKVFFDFLFVFWSVSVKSGIDGMERCFGVSQVHSSNGVCTKCAFDSKIPLCYFMLLAILSTEIQLLLLVIRMREWLQMVACQTITGAAFECN
uniref:Uncharacterized protein n=1 Tax=Anopheles darlingi TaxID=43151 RepID=A0A2M4DR20_ANODA